MSFEPLKDKLPLIAAAILGLLGIIIVNRYIEGRTAPDVVERIRVLTAARTIPAGEEISPEHVTVIRRDGESATSMRTLPKESVSDVHITLPAGDTPMERQQIEERRLMLVGHRVRREISAGQPILYSDLEAAEEQTLSRALQPERRAVTVGVDALTSVGYNIYPGDRVDVMVTIQPQLMTAFGDGASLLQAARGDMSSLRDQGQMETLTTILLQDVIVLATGSDFQRGGRNRDRRRSYSSITLDVSLEEAVMLTHARTQGVLSFVARAPGSSHRVESDELDKLEIKDSTLRDRIGALDVIRADTIDVIGPHSIDSSVFERRQD